MRSNGGEAGVQAGMSYCIDRAVAVSADPLSSYSYGARGSVDFGGSFTIKSYTAAAYGGFSAGWEASKEYKK